jgi:adsorption protein B
MLAQFFFYLAAIASQMIVVIAIVYLVLGFDDVIFDIAFWAMKIRRAIQFGTGKRLDPEMLRAQRQQRVAIFIPCWNESEIVDRMLEFAIRAIDYENYTIFVGVYPNDEATIAKAQKVAAVSDRVVVAVNPKPGPTTKADNLNSMYRTLEEYEKDGERFAMVVLHDVEDVIHPFSMLLFNFLIPRKAMVQLPVFPLERDWHQWTAWTYADEFAENHLKDLVGREWLGSFVPSAGVGCAFSREALEHIDNGSETLFSTESLTEDYQAGLRLRNEGFSTIFVHQRLATRVHHGGAAAAYVATRAYFPDTLNAAVRQKARWIVGICIQAWRDHGWHGSFINRYSLYRDRKAVVANLVTLLGYFVFTLELTLLVLHRVFPWIAEARIAATPFNLALASFVLTMSVSRVFQKVYFVTMMYGAREGVLAVLRFPWSSLINAMATSRAMYLVAKAAIQHEDVVWHKTAHVFPTEASLTECKRQLGEILLDLGKIAPHQLEQALAVHRTTGQRVGEILVSMGFAHALDIERALAMQ